MHIMGMMNDQKRIYINQCAFCTLCHISDKLRCSDLQTPQDECGKFDEVKDVSARVNELFEKLPTEYGRKSFSERNKERYR